METHQDDRNPKYIRTGGKQGVHTICAVDRKGLGCLLVVGGVLIPPGGLLRLMVVFEVGGGAFQQSLAVLATQERPAQRPPWFGKLAM